MSRNGVIILIVAAVAFAAIGFFIGQSAEAIFNAPGSGDDPMVSQSYVEQLVGERTAVLQTQLDQLEAEVNALKGGGSVPTNANNNGGGDSGDDNNGGSASADKKVEITSTSVNVRKEASTDSDKIGSVSKGDKLDYLGTEGEWYKVRLSSGEEGYVASFLAKLS